VQAGPVAIGREKAERLAVGVIGLANLLREANRGKRTADT
jgi:hypothetical protein